MFFAPPPSLKKPLLWPPWRSREGGYLPCQRTVPTIPFPKYLVEQNYPRTIYKDCRAGAPPPVVRIKRIVAASLCRGASPARSPPLRRSRGGCPLSAVALAREENWKLARTSLQAVRSEKPTLEPFYCLSQHRVWYCLIRSSTSV